MNPTLDTTTPADASHPKSPPAASFSAGSALELSLIVPTINEAENLPELARRISESLAGRSYELIIIDDNSRDQTPAVCAKLAQTYPLKLLVRTEPKNGLGGAVLLGMAHAQGRVFVVMDADLQHPPEKLPALIEPLNSGDADFVVGSRYIAGGSTEAEWGLFRKLNSWVATALARPFAGKVTDPMSGFFALRRETYESAQRLTPLGYKIALELMCKCRVQRVKEVPIHFAMRLKGQSKLSLKQQFRYLEHLSRLYDFTFPRASPIAKFLIATAIGWFAAFGAFGMALLLGHSHTAAPIIAYPANILATALLHLRYVRTQREFLIRPRPWLDFTVISMCEWIACAIVAVWVQHRLIQPGWGESFLLPMAAATVVRYILRKEFMQDIRGLRKDLRVEEIAVADAGQKS